MAVPTRYAALDVQLRNARRPSRGPRPSLSATPFTLAPLPVWAALDAAARRAKHTALVADIEASTPAKGDGPRSDRLPRASRGIDDRALS